MSMEKAKVVKRTRCPKCFEQGGDRRGDNLVIYDSGAMHCFACGYHVHPNGLESIDKVILFELAPHLNLPYGLRSKKLLASTTNKFNVVGLVETKSDGTPIIYSDGNGNHNQKFTNKLAFPYYDLDSGALIGAKIRVWKSKADNGKSHDTTWFEGQTERITYFGLSCINSSIRTLVLTEGETDTLSVAQAVPEVNCLGVSGANRAAVLIQKTLHFLKKFDRIILAFDNDAAGNKAIEECVAALPVGKAYVATLPADVKDCNDLVVQGREAELRNIILNARQILPNGIVDKQDLKQRVLDKIYKRNNEMGVSTGFPSLDKVSGGFREGKLYTIAAGTGVGKSLFLESLILNAAKQGLKSFFIPLEMCDSEVMQRLVQQHTGYPVCADPYFDSNLCDPRKIDEALEFVTEHVRFYNHFGSIKTQELIDICEFAIDAFGVKLICLDHLTAASESLDWKDLEATVKALKHLAVRKRVCVIAVSHISRDGNNEDDVPKLSHLRGGNGVAQYSDMVLGLGRPRESLTTVVRTIKKERTVGKYAEFYLEIQNQRLIEKEKPNQPLTKHKDDEEYEYKEEKEKQEQTTTNQTSKNYEKPIPKSVRVHDTPESSRAGVRTVQTQIQNGDELHSRLHPTERNNGGGEREFHPNRQEEDIDGDYPKPINRFTYPVPAFPAPFSEFKDDIHRVVQET